MSLQNFEFCISIVFNFSWEIQSPQETLKMMFMQTFWGTTTSIMMFLKKAYWASPFLVLLTSCKVIAIVNFAAIQINYFFWAQLLRYVEIKDYAAFKGTLSISWINKCKKVAFKHKSDFNWCQSWSHILKTSNQSRSQNLGKTCLGNRPSAC